MVGGLLRTSESAEGDTIGLIRENGQVEDVTIVPEAGAGGVVRAKWALNTSSMTFAAGVGPVYDIVTEPGTLAGIVEGETIFFQPVQCLQGPFHSGSPAPQFGGKWLIVTKSDDQEMSVQRSSDLATTAQIDATALITADQGSAAGVYQVATPAGGTIDTDPQVMPWVARPVPAGDGNTYKLQSSGEQLFWTLDP